MPAVVESAAPSEAGSAAPPPPPPNGDVQIQTGGISKKKKKSKGTTARGPTALPRSRGTGFEEYYADPPLTPAEHEEEMGLYSPMLSFDERIETCIQRFRARRRLDNERSHLFSRYLTVGGVNCEPRQFNGTAGLYDTEGFTKDELRAMAANDVVARAGSKYSKYYATDNADLWAIDFAGVASGFFSVSLRAIASGSEKQLTLGVDVVDNFLRYVQIHDVCPEYRDDVNAARVVCAKALTELPNCRTALTAMPGQFNLACVRLFYREPAHKAFNDGLDPLNEAPAYDEAAEVFRTIVALQKGIVGEQGAAMAAQDLAGIRIVSTKEVDLEVTSLAKAKEDVAERYAELARAAAAATGRALVLRPTSVVVAKHYSIEEGYANQPHPTAAELAARGGEALLFDDALVALLCVGTKLRVVVHELSCGFSFVSSVKDVLPSFYTFLPQELMLDWKEPRDNEREAPSVQNPDAEDQAVQNMLDAEKD
ncbi:Argonaute complex, subunit Arb1 [Niveomyces insectorum RCEF 264]|uniref:Argonaute complex, subunit Arb1 n=1 Tax=Niveomyces insectorum RCEF 264 TaxID=1081102 RepID=A0A167YW59_9HYPO|nr:Argonaute complex, subunit Arb1 [Niveomyces insectorum RCEF 264]